MLIDSGKVSGPKHPDVSTDRSGMRKNVADEVSSAYQEITDDLVDHARIDQGTIAGGFDNDVRVARLRRPDDPVEHVVFAPSEYVHAERVRVRGYWIVGWPIDRCDHDLVDSARATK